ncbi:hypothetical protein QFC20_006861 [Naganishia adeliensis]|uniref:Uncharacterized protein n=1 Tax=Naganishia adeliensis TaxID=92952 RepID=A0ACC2V740_9TREE|nr:hypothetical protein QFC20_006861 [Naganishia adeliensis]
MIGSTILVRMDAEMVLRLLFQNDVEMTELSHRRERQQGSDANVDTTSASNAEASTSHTASPPTSFSKNVFGATYQRDGQIYIGGIWPHQLLVVWSDTRAEHSTKGWEIKLQVDVGGIATLSAGGEERQVDTTRVKTRIGRCSLSNEQTGVELETHNNDHAWIPQLMFFEIRVFRYFATDDPLISLGMFPIRLSLGTRTRQSIRKGLHIYDTKYAITDDCHATVFTEINPGLAKLEIDSDGWGMLHAAITMVLKLVYSPAIHLDGGKEAGEEKGHEENRWRNLRSSFWRSAYCPTFSKSVPVVTLIHASKIMLTDTTWYPLPSTVTNADHLQPSTGHLPSHTIPPLDTGL